MIEGSVLGTLSPPKMQHLETNGFQGVVVLGEYKSLRRYNINIYI